MKYLTAVRHAKAEDATAWADDFMRPLTERGQRDAKAVARIIEGLEPAADWWLTSPAVRALQTAQQIRRALPESFGSEANGLHQEPDIYMATPEALLALVRQTPPSQTHLVLIGHNPGLEALVAGLCAGGTPSLNFRMPTACTAHLELEVAHWEQVRWGCGALRLLVSPKHLKK